jgi:hypothetical protein
MYVNKLVEKYRDNFVLMNHQVVQGPPCDHVDAFLILFRTLAFSLFA